jgi:hypothetical protein
LRVVAAGSVLLVSWLSSCAPSGFQDEAQLQGGVRILASSADHPYAAPGEAVRVSVLAYDGRSAAVRDASPMRLFWLPAVCQNPLLDAYYGCFEQFAHPDGGSTIGQVLDEDAASDAGLGEADAGTDAGNDEADGSDSAPSGDAASDSGADAAAGPSSPVVSSFTFVVPTDAVSSHLVSPGANPYGLEIAFNFACAGNLTLLPLGGNPQSPPLGCADANGNLLGPDSYVFGYTRVYAYPPDAGPAGSNTNPVVDCVDLRGAGLDAGTSGAGGCAGALPLMGAAPSFTVPTVAIPGCSPTLTHCSPLDIGPHVTPDSWELGANGQHEEIWVDYYSSFGSFTHDAMLVYDPTAGLVGPLSKTDTEFDPPSSPASPDGYVWMVVHDNRGGAVWVTVPVHLGP